MVRALYTPITALLLLLLHTLIPGSLALLPGDRLASHMKKVHGLDSVDPKTAFDLHNLDGSLGLEMKELSHFYREHNDDSDETAFKTWFDHVMEGADLNRDGRISFDEFQRDAFEDRVFSESGLGAKIPQSGSLGASSWQQSHHADAGQSLHVQISYRNVPLKYRMYKESTDSIDVDEH
ncbi:MAG: hypothetical protein DHS80DRAFT_32343 [Piptocephalis tieghemiana]|nr:MAG: hypothetical protein DHS80DRAFT_32343 [Piptocephalis tieghemiana]